MINIKVSEIIPLPNLPATQSSPPRASIQICEGELTQSNEESTCGILEAQKSQFDMNFSELNCRGWEKCYF